MERRFLIGGSGGQGILFMGKLMAAAAMISGKNVTWFPSYGAEIRCGTANCTVIASDEPIGSPVIKHIDVLIVFNDMSLKKFIHRLKPDGILFYDSSLLFYENGTSGIKAVGIPATTLASELGSKKSANMLMLGAVASVTDMLFLKKDALLSVMENDSMKLPSETLLLNKIAIAKGFDIVENQKRSNL
ncbi:2-oxoacid:acceptor oxidoreductase family protein [Candidatus Magnetomonas plexicatena]|uniref:2-oxoacid:acceptor oxidoreductase family protein n=1 Tax=Candidatus Magnetomonas plexicatena TaxID=2552947 RepID=UPI0011024DBC|nr:2-oxoacid:ferredoxin oxidoreductase subunit gamma [Nitrospirales bacterium LBB_01]